MEKVLVLTDFTPTCFWSVTYGLDFCHYYGLEPEVLHVETGARGEVSAIERAKVEDTLGLYNKKFAMRATLATRRGPLDMEVAREAESGGFALLVLCTHGKQGLQSVTGSAVEKIIHSLSIPIIVVQSKRFAPVRQVVLPVAVPSFNPGHLSKIAAMARIMGARVEVACRSEHIQFCESQSAALGCASISVMERNGLTFARQVAKYCESRRADMLMCISPCERDQQFLSMMDQLIFNIPQIPVMCR